MRKMKKLAALILAGAMVMGMSTTAFAASDATITIDNAGNGKFNCVQIIQADPTTATGWDIVDEYADEFEFGFGIADEQVILAGMIYEQNAQADKGVEIADFDNKYAATLGKISIADGNLTSPITVNAAGVYFIKGTETGFNYSPIAAYVAFGPYDQTTGVPTDLVNTNVEAKKAPTTVVKDAELDVKDEVTEVSRTETYSVNSTVPYLPLTDANRQYWAKDAMTGAEYAVIAEGDNAGKLAVEVKIAGSLYDTYYVAPTTNVSTGASFALDLTDILAENLYANQTIELSYDVIVKDTQVHNDINMGDGTNNTRFGQDSEDLYTGKIVLTKYATDANNDDLTDNAKLAGAEFKVYKTVNDVKSWATFDSNYKFVDWVEAEADATVVVTGADGTLTVKGLDLGTYSFKEVKAPEGYSINKTDVSATLALPEGATEATAELSAGTQMIDTTLSALPGTGGIGTTIFTVGGVAIIIAAAALFMARRRVAR